MELTDMTRAELLAERKRIDVHIDTCCAASDGTCHELTRLGSVDYLLDQGAAWMAQHPGGDR